MKPDKYVALLASIQAILAEDEFNSTYGKRRMYEKLQLDYDCPCYYNYNIVAKMMRKHGLLHRPKGLTKADKAAQKLDNLLKQDFSADALNPKTVTDITEWTACDGKGYQSSVFDCFDNACLGLSMADSMHTELCVETLQAAGQYDLRGAVSHSDRGPVYQRRVPTNTRRSRHHPEHERRGGPLPRQRQMREHVGAGERGNHGLLRHEKMTCEQLRQLIFRYYMGYWNNRRICSAIGGMSPAVKRGAYFEMLADRVD
jgi:transposase InsO family protein